MQSAAGGEAARYRSQTVCRTGRHRWEERTVAWGAGRPSEHRVRRVRGAGHDDGLFGVSESILEAFATLERVANAEMHVLITGETGVGKNMFAQALHRHSKQKDERLTVLDCAALPEGLADTMLFGHRRGAFTGAEYDRVGIFEQAEGSTLLIDEVGELSLSVQAKLLRVLESMEVTRLGDERIRTVDVRVVSTTHEDLPSLIEQGRFREELYFRLAEIHIDVPSLRARGGRDIEYLAKRFLDAANKKAGTSLNLSQAALDALCKHRWRGNVRELRSVIRRLPVLLQSSEIQAEHLALSDYQPRRTQLDEIVRTGSLKEIHLALDRWLLPPLLKAANGNISETARRLGVGRKALTTRIEEIGIKSWDAG